MTFFKVHRRTFCQRWVKRRLTQMLSILEVPLHERLYPNAIPLRKGEKTNRPLNQTKVSIVLVNFSFYT